MFIILETVRDHISSDPVYRYAEPNFYFSTRLQAEKYVRSQTFDAGACTNTTFKILELRKFILSKDG